MELALEGGRGCLNKSGEVAAQEALRRQELAQADPANKRLRSDLAARQHAIALRQFALGKNARYQTDVAVSRSWLSLARTRARTEFRTSAS